MANRRNKYMSLGIVAGVVVGLLISPSYLAVTIPLGVAIGYIIDRQHR